MPPPLDPPLVCHNTLRQNERLSGEFIVLVGNMWAQEWDYIYDLVEPYQNKPAIDVTSSLKQQARHTNFITN